MRHRYDFEPLELLVLAIIGVILPLWWWFKPFHWRDFEDDHDEPRYWRSWWSRWWW